MKKMGQRFKESEVLSVFVQILLGLKHCHEKNILHRDIKPLYIFLTKEGKAKLGDFGISKMVDS